MMHGQRRHETEDRDHGWSREGQDEWEGGRTYLSLEGDARLGRSFAQTADAHMWSKAIVGAEADGERGNAHRIVPVECLGGSG